MNCIAKNTCLLATIVIACVACNAPATETLVAGDPLRYSVLYSIVPNPAAGTIDVAMRVTQPRDLLRELRFSKRARISKVRADGGELFVQDKLVWRPAANGGTLRWTVTVANKRNGNGYDAWLDEAWGLLRAEDIVPRAATVTLRGAYSDTTLKFDLPDAWTVVTAYANKDGRFEIDKPQRRFDQPDGWIVMGQLGVRRETIAGMRVAVAGPVNQSVRRMDTLALLNWNLPELARILPELPPRLTIVSAGSPMWRGGLSAPQSLYVHAERPLISENATSTLLHEVMHSALRISTTDGYDWIVEGLAEYYSLQLLRRSGTISPARYSTALDEQVEWSESARTLCQRSSTGADTALAVRIMAELDDEIQRATDDGASLDELLPVLQQRDGPVDLQILQREVELLTGKKSDVLDINRLPGCRSIATGNQEIT
ncbi:MAG: hypothetical protein ACR2QT_11125 [Woeseiaceae bacterium]